VAGFRPAFHINRLLEMKGSLQEPENPAATPERAAATDVNPIIKASQCFLHEGIELGLYCETCGELICWKCVIKGGKHRDHDYDELEQAFEKYKVEIASLLEPLEKQVATTKTALAQLDTRCGEISDQRAATAINVHTTFRRLREALDVRETEVISQLDRVAQRKLKGLATQRDQIETTLAQQCSCLHFMRGSLRRGTEGDVLMMKTNTVKQAKALTTPLQRRFLEPNTEAGVEFLASADIVAECRNYGQIIELTLPPDPMNCKLESNLKAGKVGEKCTAIVHTVNSKGEPCEKFEVLECEFVSEISSTRARCSVYRRGLTQYEINYQPTIKGRNQLHIKVKGQHIRGSPFSVAVKSPVEKLGTPILTIDEMAKPWGVAINQRGEVVVTESGGHCVSVFSLSGVKLRSFGTRGSGLGQFQYPREVAVDGEGNILVADSAIHRIQKFTPEGRYLTSVGTEGSRCLQFSFPTGIAFNASNNKIYVGDTGNHRVQVLNSDLTFSSTFGRHGRGKGQFNEPFGIACDSTGSVLVADQSNHRIQAFSAEGRFLRKFGRYGHGRGELCYPVGVAIDAGDMVYVSENDNDYVSVFTSVGKFVTSFGREGKGAGEFSCPHGLAVDNSGVVYVCDRFNDRVQVF
jgi:tripartite motif-containing protein 2/3/tripartite motif-containing protein 71